MALKAKIVGLVLALFSMPGSPAFATVYSVTFDNVLIDNNPNYTITGSFLYDSTQSQNPGELYGLSNFQVSATTPYGVFDMNTVWTVDSTFTYLGLETGPCCSSDVPAILLEFLDRTNGDGNADNLQIAAINSLNLPILPLTSTDGSALTPSVTVLYDGPRSDLLNITGSLVVTPLPAALPLFATGIGGLGLLGWQRKRRAQAGG